jgi:Peptidase M15.
MTENIYIITREDTLISLNQWQFFYDLRKHPLQIGKYFIADEPKFAQDLRDYGKLYVSELLMRVMDKARERWGKPLRVNSFNRNEAKQDALRASGARAATTSPHVVYLAMDVDTTSAADTRKLAKIILQAAKDLGIKVRVGYEDYLAQGSTFVHVDVCPEYYGPGKRRNHLPHPKVWEMAYLTW